MRIGIISRSNLNDRIYWSGSPYNIYSRLKSYKNLKIIKIDCLDNKFRKVAAFKREYLKYFKDIKFDDSYNDFVAKDFSNQIQKKIKNKQIDILLTFEINLIAYLKTNVPIVLWTDLLYSDYYDYYFKGIKISKDTKESIKNLEKMALNNCHKIILTSKWSIRKAKEKYKNLSSKFNLLHLGPGFNKSIDSNKIKKIIKKRSKTNLRLITLGVRRKRKGLSKVIKLNKILNNKGFNSKLTIIGIKKIEKIDENIKLVGFVDKNNSNGESKISRNLAQNHFHILFSKKEAYGIALVEANSRGVPNITFKTGGIPQIVKNNKNGFIFKQSESLEKIANKIIKIFKNYSYYNKLANSSYRIYNKYYSFEVIIPKLIKILNSN